MVHLDFLRQDLSLDLEHTDSASPADQRVLGTLCLASIQHCWSCKHVTMLYFLCGPRKLSSGPHALNPPSISLVHFSHLTCKEVKGWGTDALRRDQQPQAQLRRQPARATQHSHTSVHV